MIPALLYAVAAVVGAILVTLAATTRIVKDNERAVVFRLGRVRGARAPGVVFVSPLDRVVRVSTQSVAIAVPFQQVITKDSVTLGISAALYIRVVDPVRAITEIDDYRCAAFRAAQTTLRSIVSQVELDDVLLDRQRLNQELHEGIDRVLGPYGVAVALAELDDLELTPTMREAMARDAEAERDRRSKVIAAQGESEAADALSHAAAVMERHPAAMQLRILSTMAELSGRQGTTVIVPVPVELLRLVERLAPAGGEKS